MTSAAMREQVSRARDVQARRFRGANSVDCSARITERAFARLCPMESAAEKVFILAQKNLLVSARARGHIVRVARSIADLDGSERISEPHIAEAVGYRGRTTR